MKTTIRGIETFVFTLISAFFSLVVVAGQPVDVTDPASQAALVTAFLTAVGVAVRQWSATRGA